MLAHIRDPLVKDYAVQATAEFCSLSREAVEKSMGGIQTTEQKRPLVRERAPRQRTAGLLISELLQSVSALRVFLLLHKVEIPEETKHLLEAVLQYEHLPDTDEKVAVLECEERFSDAETRADMALRAYTELLDRLHREMQKREELKKLRA